MDEITDLLKILDEPDEELNEDDVLALAYDHLLSPDVYDIDPQDLEDAAVISEMVAQTPHDAAYCKSLMAEYKKRSRKFRELKKKYKQATIKAHKGKLEWTKLDQIYRKRNNAEQLVKATLMKLKRNHCV